MPEFKSVSKSAVQQSLFGDAVPGGRSARRRVARQAAREIMAGAAPEETQRAAQTQRGPMPYAVQIARTAERQYDAAHLAFVEALNAGVASAALEALRQAREAAWQKAVALIERAWNVKE